MSNVINTTVRILSGQCTQLWQVVCFRESQASYSGVFNAAVLCTFWISKVVKTSNERQSTTPHTVCISLQNSDAAPGGQRIQLPLPARSQGFTKARDPSLLCVRSHMLTGDRQTWEILLCADNMVFWFAFASSRRLPLTYSINEFAFGGGPLQMSWASGALQRVSGNYRHLDSLEMDSVLLPSWNGKKLTEKPRGTCPGVLYP